MFEQVVYYVTRVLKQLPINMNNLVFYTLMDDATYVHLVKKRMVTHTPPSYDMKEYQTKIIELTQSLFETKMTGSLQTAFDAYVHECIHHFKQKELPPPLPPPLSTLPADSMMIKPKKVLHYLVKPKK